MQWQIYLYNTTYYRQASKLFVSPPSNTAVWNTEYFHVRNVEWLTKEDKSVLLVGRQWLTSIMTLLTDFWWSKMLISHWWAYHKIHYKTSIPEEIIGLQWVQLAPPSNTAVWKNILNTFTVGLRGPSEWLVITIFSALSFTSTALYILTLQVGWCQYKCSFHVDVCLVLPKPMFLADSIEPKCNVHRLPFILLDQRVLQQLCVVGSVFHIPCQAVQGGIKL